MHTDTRISAVLRSDDLRLLLGLFCTSEQVRVQRSAVAPLTRLLLPPRFQDGVAPVGGVVVRYEWDVERSEERR